MANMSSANGTFEFDKDFYRDNQKLIEKYFQKAVLGGFYGIDIVESTNSPIFKFTASGRWSMQNTLPWALTPVCFSKEELNNIEQEQVDLFEALYKQLIESGTRIKFEYNDEESGVGFLVHDTATVVPNEAWQQDKGQDCFLVKDYQSKDLGFNDKNVIVKDYEDGYDMGNEEDVEYLKQDYLNDWYQQQDDNFKAEHSLEDVIEALKDLANKDTDYNGAFCWWRFDNDCNGMIEKALKQK